MIELIKQSLYLGMGVASLTREKLMDFGKEIAARAQLSKEQAKQFEEDLVNKADQAREDLRAEIDRRVDHAFIQMGIVKSNVMKAGEEATSNLGVMFEDRFNQALDRMKVARTEEIDALKTRVELLEKKLTDMQK